jgi:hypothetical protein
MRLGEFIQTNAATIIAAWERGLRASPASRGLGRPALIDHVPRLLEDFARIIQTREQEPPLIEIADAHTDTHVVERVEQGFSAGDVVGEPMLLRTCILRLWHASHPTITVGGVHRRRPRHVPRSPPPDLPPLRALHRRWPRSCCATATASASSRASAWKTR